MKNKPLFNRIEDFLGSLKCAVIIIIIFTIVMILGTLAESYYGTEFANRLIYKTWPFMLIQLFMFLSIIMATFKRFPIRKSYYGFYTLHLGLLLLFCGSFITYHSGIDGNITLIPGVPARNIELPEDQLRIQTGRDEAPAVMDLPSSAFESSLDTEFKGIQFRNFIPYSENEVRWRETNQKHTSASYIIANQMVSQNFILSNHPDAKGFESTISMGPLTVHFLPKSLFKCFAENNPSKLIIWNSKENSCFIPEDQKIEIKKTSENNRFLVFPYEGKLLSFFPDFSPWPLNEKLQIQKDTPLKIFSKNLFEGAPNLFLFGEALSYFEDDSWVASELKAKTPHELPWMGFEIELQKSSDESYPYHHPVAVLPIQKNGQVVKGGQRALEFEYKGQSYWVTDSKPVYIENDGDWFNISLSKQTLTLPFEFMLTRFKMDTDPGTNNPASYESFVQLFEGQKGASKHHIFMNNPLKHAGFTFYQASYFKTNSGDHGSVLSANFDPGRAIKYFGSLILVLGTIWHYLIRRKKKGAFFNTQGQQV